MMESKNIYDNKGLLRGRIVFDVPNPGDKTLYDKRGLFAGKYSKAMDATFDKRGIRFGSGDQLTSLLED